MTDEWPKSRFADICEHSAFGPRFSGELYAPDGNVATLRTTDISEDGRIEYATMPLAHLDLPQFRQHILRENDLVITRSGRVGTATVFGGFRLPVLPGAFLIRFRLKREVAEPHFYRYYFNSAAGHRLITSVATGSVQQNLNITSLHRLVVPLPPLSEQRAIARLLGTLDDKIELNRRMNEALEAMARAIFKSWFVDFDPVRAKAEARQPPGTDAESARLFPRSFEVSSLGKIPKGWRVGQIGNVVDAVGGSTPSTKDPTYWDGTINFATPKDMALLRSPILQDTERRITEAGLQQIGSGLLPRGTVLLSSRAPIGYLAVAEIPVAVNQGIIAMKCEKELPNLYVLYWTRENLDTIIAHANGTTFLEISKTNFRPIEVVIPPAPLVARFTKVVEPLYRQVVNNLTHSKTLASIRDALLPKLISGEIRVGSI